MSSRNREFVVRFAVGGDKRGVRSSVWRIWKGRNKDDIYVAPRPVAGMLKGSLHASGVCHFAVTAQHHAQMLSAGTASHKRQITTWHRRMTPTDGFTLAVQILFASEFLSRKSSPADGETNLIGSPEPGEAIVVDLIFARMAGKFFLMPHQCELGSCTLSNGEQFLIIAGLADDFDAGGFQRRFSPLQQWTSPSFALEQPSAEPDDLRGALLLPDPGDGVLRIVEVGPSFDFEVSQKRGVLT